MLKEIEKKCTDMCVGMIVWKDDCLLMVERKKQPFGFAIPTGHLELEEGDNFERAVIRELKEETGLIAVKLIKILEDVIFKNGFICSKGSAKPHIVILYRVFYRSGVLIKSEENKSVDWYSVSKIHSLALRTDKYLNGHISEREWQNSPGLEPLCYNWFKNLGILSIFSYKNI